MAGAPLRTASSSDFSSVRDDFSSWLDDIFPPSRLKIGKQLQRPSISREQYANITAKLRKALPMELPQTSKRLVAQRRVSTTPAPRHGQVRDEDTDTDEKPALNTVQTSRQPPPPRIKRSPSLPFSTLPIRHLHHHRRRPFEGRKYAVSTLAPQSHHPATFADMKYTSHRPGLRFFEYVPSLACITMAATVVFLGPEASKRAGGEVLWLRTSAAGIMQRRVFSSARCFRASPKLRRRVALSLCGQHISDGGMGIMRASARAPGALRRLLGARGTESQTEGVQHPAALLKAYRPCSRHSGTRHGKNHDNESKQERVREKEGGGRTDVWCLDNLSEIEDILRKAGEGEHRQSENRPDIATAQEQQQQLEPQEPKVRLSSDNGGALSKDLQHDGAYQRTEKERDIAPEPGTNEADEAREMVSSGDHSVPKGPMSLKENALQIPRRCLSGESKAEVVERARPWAIQKYLRPKGQLAWYVENLEACWLVTGKAASMLQRTWLGWLKHSHFLLVSNENALYFRCTAYGAISIMFRPLDLFLQTTPASHRSGGGIVAANGLLLCTYLYAET